MSTANVQFMHRLTLAAAMAIGLSACGQQQEATPPTPTPAPAPAPAPPAAAVLEGQVDIIAWPGYIERGETDKAYDWVSEFEKTTSCKVNVKTAGTYTDFEQGFPAMESAQLRQSRARLVLTHSQTNTAESRRTQRLHFQISAFSPSPRCNKIFRTS